TFYGGRPAACPASWHAARYQGAEVTIVHHSYLRWLHTQGVPLKEMPAQGVYDPAGGWLLRRKSLFAQRAPGLPVCRPSLRERRAA
ncbi:ADP-ribosylglycohydrolase, partial [Nitritalea halalkaliphila LW7]